MPRFLLAALFALCVAACGTLGGGTGKPLDASLFPFEASTKAFRVSGGGARQVRIEPGADPTTVDLFVTGEGLDEQRMTVRRDDSGLRFSNGPQAGVELIRLGARPGAEWESGSDEIRFVGWERITVPAGTFDAARLTTTRGTDELQLRQTWWFASGLGIVRIHDDRGGLMTSDLVRVER